MPTISNFFKFKLKLICFLIVVLFVFSLINIKLYLKRTEKEIADYRAITETYKHQLIKLVRKAQPGNTHVSIESPPKHQLTALRARAGHVQSQCEKMHRAEKDEYKIPTYESYGNYWWDYANEERSKESLVGGELPSNPTVEDSIPDDAEIPITYHIDFREHGPTAIAPAYNFLVSVPEKCGSEFWFKIFEYLNFPQISWPRDGTDKKHYQMKYIIPMVHEIPGAAESLQESGVTVAVVRHPFIRLYSAYRGFFTKTALPRDRKFAKWWLESSSAFRELVDDNQNIKNNLIQIEDGPDTEIDIMSFEQFLEGIINHLESTEKAKYRRRWAESGEDHISPLYAILQPCHYPFQFYVKVENLSAESRELFDAISIDLPSEYLLPTHQSDILTELPQDHVKKHYSSVPHDTRSKLQKFYQIDLDFFQYTINIDTLEITY